MKRLSAFVVDVCLLAAILSLFDFTISRVTKYPVTLLAGAMISFLYIFLMEGSRKQASVGKIVMGLIVSDMHGQRISFVTSAHRTAVKIVHLFCVIILVGWINAVIKYGYISAISENLFVTGFIRYGITGALLSSLFLSILTTKRRQALHDLAANTIVKEKADQA